MWIVRLALKRPYTFVVMALLICVLGGLAIVRMPADIFPEINVPVASVIWSLAGISAEEMADMVTIRAQRGYTSSVNDIEHMEGQSLQGLGIIKIFFHPNAKVEAAVAQLTAASNSMVHYLPIGIAPPSILRYNASAVPILQLVVSSDSLSEQILYDYSFNFVRTQMATVQGVTLPMPYGGKPRQIMVDLKPDALMAKGMNPQDVVNAVNNQSLLQPSGTAKIGGREYPIKLNNSPEAIQNFNHIPVKVHDNGAVTFMNEVADVHDGYQVQTNIVRHDGQRSLLLTVLKNGSASTIDVVASVKKILPRIASTMPPEVKMSVMFDQSIFVRAAIISVLKEAAIAAMLTGLMILLFLGSWRSTLIVCVSIPCSILTSLGVMYLMGETINVMTLGGLALAVGILVDDATVEIENIHRNIGLGKPIIRAILDGAQQIAVPTFVSTLCICIVFMPVLFLSGASKFLFTPLALAVALAMAASYLLSRTLVPTMVRYLIPAEIHLYKHGSEEEEPVPQNAGIIWRVHHLFNHWFELRRKGYLRLLEAALDHRKTILGFFVMLTLVCAALIPWIGEDFFPTVDAGQIRLHVRTPAGTRIEQTEAIFANVEDSIKKLIPKEEISDIIDNIGLPYTGNNMAYSDSVTVGSFDGEILVSLKPDHQATPEYVKLLRRELNREYHSRGLTFFFQPADIVSQILNFGIPAPIDIQIAGPIRNYHANQLLAKEIEREVAGVPGAADVHVHQIDDLPDLRIDVDRTRAQQHGITQADVSHNMVVTLASSSFVSTNWWLNPASGIDYLVAVQTPTHVLDSTDSVMNTPVQTSNGTPMRLDNFADLHRGRSEAVVNHVNAQPVVDIQANTQERDLGAVAGDIDKILAKFEPKLQRGSYINVRGQVKTMNDSFRGMGFGILFAILLVYFIMVVNFQSWLDPFIILMALPGALSGILLMLFVTQTTINVPSLMGAIMSIGVATANSILLVNFANEVRRNGLNARQAALEAGATRLRPVIMTACAMLAGMIPMTLGMGEGGEQNAPLGRAVIGGLAVATFATLFFVPVVYSYLRKNAPVEIELDSADELGEGAVKES
ncbi:MAG TPA: efflux RND transporter permease subunit [Bryobacteraceae bacterium]|jgi:multidrug efflux pump subunit AcrB